MAGFHLTAGGRFCLTGDNPVRHEDVVHLSPFARKHINVHGRHSFLLPELPGGRRALRDPDEVDDEEE